VTKIDARLNLVVPVERETGPLYVYALPLSRAAFDANFLLISKTFAALYQEGLSFVAGGRVGGLMLRQVARDMKQPEAADALLSELRRTASAVLLVDGKWTPIPLEDALNKGVLDPEDAAEVEGAMTFFMVASAMHKRSQLASILEGMAGLWGAQITSSPLSDLIASLPASTPPGHGGRKATQSSIPS